MTEVGDRKWTIAVGDAFTFEIVPAEPGRYGLFGSNADLNGAFDTKLAASEEALAGLLDSKRSLAAAVAKARRMVAYYSRKVAP